MAGVDQPDDLHAPRQHALRPELQIIVEDRVFDCTDRSLPTGGIGGQKDLVIAAALITRQVRRLRAMAGEVEDHRIPGGRGSCGCFHSCQNIAAQRLGSRHPLRQAFRISRQHCHRAGVHPPQGKGFGHQPHIIGGTLQVGIQDKIVANPDQYRPHLCLCRRRGGKEGDDAQNGRKGLVHDPCTIPPGLRRTSDFRKMNGFVITRRSKSRLSGRGLLLPQSADAVGKGNGNPAQIFASKPGASGGGQTHYRGKGGICPQIGHGIFQRPKPGVQRRTERGAMAGRCLLRLGVFGPPRAIQHQTARHLWPGRIKIGRAGQDCVDCLCRVRHGEKPGEGRGH